MAHPATTYQHDTRAARIRKLKQSAARMLEDLNNLTDIVDARAKRYGADDPDVIRGHIALDQMDADRKEILQLARKLEHEG